MLLTDFGDKSVCTFLQPFSPSYFSSRSHIFLQEAIAKEAFLQNDKTTTRLLGFDAGTLLSSNTHSPLKLTPPRRKKTISLAETLPVMSQPQFENLDSNSDDPELKKTEPELKKPELNSKFSKVSNEKEQISVTSTEIEKTYLNLVHGPPWFIKNGEPVVNDIGITFGFALGVGFTSIVAFLSARLSVDQATIPAL